MSLIPCNISDWLSEFLRTLGLVHASSNLQVPKFTLMSLDVSKPYFNLGILVEG